MGAYENVFGADVKFDDLGNPIETGIGSEAHPDRVALRERLARQAQDKAVPLLAAEAVEPVQATAVPVEAVPEASPVEAPATEVHDETAPEAALDVAADVQHL